jgi:hypothetical protein
MKIVIEGVGTKGGIGFGAGTEVTGLLKASPFLL